jgi:Fic family protein
MRHSTKDEWHRGGYKQMPNEVEATHADGSKYTVFKTTTPGQTTEDAMKQLIEWYHADIVPLPIIKVALFVYEFLSIHPFQDGNGRLSRLLATLLLLQHKYSWIQYVSFEHEIENRKAEYYRVLMQAQKQRPGEPVDEWLAFFLDCLSNIQKQLMDKLDKTGSAAMHSPRERNILAFVENHPGCKSGEIAEKLNIPLATLKKTLSTMVAGKMIVRYGIGKGSNYVMSS